MNEWILRLDEGPADGPRLAVKDAIDVAGYPTTVGSPALRDRAAPAAADAPCIATARAFGARIVGKTNLHELCFGTTGLNAAFGHPVNPRWPDLVPGGSSSGSAVAVALGEADVAFGTDTGCSVRMPAACCGIAGLKTTHGRISIDGVWPLAPSFDTIGPLARDVAGLVLGMQMLVPGFSIGGIRPATTVGRLAAPPGVPVDPTFDAAVDRALAAAGFAPEPVALAGWDRAAGSFAVMIDFEAWQSSGRLLATGLVQDYVARRLGPCEQVTSEAYTNARRTATTWTAEVLALLQRSEVLAMPTLSHAPVPVGDKAVMGNGLNLPFNVAGTPAISIPVGPNPGESLQLIAAPGGEELLLATAAVVERAVGILPRLYTG